MGRRSASKAESLKHVIEHALQLFPVKAIKCNENVVYGTKLLVDAFL